MGPPPLKEKGKAPPVHSFIGKRGGIRENEVRGTKKKGPVVATGPLRGSLFLQIGQSRCPRKLSRNWNRLMKSR